MTKYTFCVCSSGFPQGRRGGEAPGMDELLRDFLTETGESLDRVDAELVRFEQDPNNGKSSAIFFAWSTPSKAPAAFSALSRLEDADPRRRNADGQVPRRHAGHGRAVTLILSTLDRVKTILDALETREQEPEGADDDLDLIELVRLARPMTRRPQAAPVRRARAAPADARSACRNRRRRDAPGRRRQDPRPPKPATSSPAIRSGSASIRSII